MALKGHVRKSVYLLAPWFELRIRLWVRAAQSASPTQLPSNDPRYCLRQGSDEAEVDLRLRWQDAMKMVHGPV